MADDLKLQLLIQAILESKGFDEAKTAIGGLADTTNRAIPPTDEFSRKSNTLARELGGTRGAVADVTRVILQNIGVTGAAGEAAKAAGIGMNVLAGAAGGLGFAFAGAVAALAFFMPRIVEWMNATDEVTKKQDALRKEMEDHLPVLDRYAARLKTVNESLRLQMLQQRSETLRKERTELHDLTEEHNRLEKTLKEAVASQQPLNREFSKATERLMAYKGRIADLTSAYNQGITVEELYIGKIKDEDKATEERNDEIERGLRLMRLSVEGWNQLVDAEDAAIAMANEQARDADRHMHEETRRQAKKEADDRQKQVDLIHARREGERVLAEGDRAEEQSARDRTATQAGMVAAGVAALSTAFGKNKALRIATALADTYAAATAALAQPPGPPTTIPFMALAIATGLANVANIRKTELGFDDPVNDLLAAKLGRKFATDVLTHINAGFDAGMAAQAAGPTYHQTTINRGTTFQGGVHLGGFFGPSKRTLLTSLERELIKAGRRETRTKLR